MAKIKQRRVRWEPSTSHTVIGYKLYWSQQGDIGYNSDCAFIGNVTDVILPEQVPSFPLVSGSIELGITAVNEIGNESDLVSLLVPFQFSVPDPPSSLSMEAMTEYHMTTSREPQGEQKTPEDS
ncbi:MAG: hypothetical protein JW836_07035 [Deltaproteobacteria bacterium]|nr:hypothetical protein [Deltaproteobacteria bacterium]